ncbi:MAG TPA: hypothetical protein VLH94_03995 [Spirochaetia bacterium]|nr:hypothetical protein [Spirochaetia bacterium]
MKQLTLSFYVYGTMFFISALEKDGESSVKMETDDEKVETVEVKTKEDVIEFVKKNAITPPLLDEMILEDVEDAIYRTLFYLQIIIVVRLFALVSNRGFFMAFKVQYMK